MRRFVRERWLVALVLVLLIAAGAAFAWGPLRDRRDAERAQDVLEPFVEALRARDFRAACTYLADTSPPLAEGPANCPGRLRRTNIGVGWAYQLQEIETEVDGREDGRVRINAWEPEAGVFTGGPRYRFTFVREDGEFRIEHFLGYF